MIMNCQLGKNVQIYHKELVNLYGCEIGDNTRIGSFVEIGRNVKVGKNCRIQAFSFIPEGVIIEDDVFIGPGVVFTNDKYPRSKQYPYFFQKTIIKNGASIGAGSVILGGIQIGENAMIGAGSVVTKSVPPNELWIGNPAKFIRKID